MRLAVEVVVHANVALVLDASERGAAPGSCWRSRAVVGRRQLLKTFLREAGDQRLRNHAVGVDLSGVRILIGMERRKLS